MKTIPLAALILGLGTTAALAGAIESACLRSDRQAATRSLCGCIQTVADQVLTNGDQRRAAKFFNDPDQSQEVRQSDRASDAAFWTRYKNFGAIAESYCAG